MILQHTFHRHGGQVLELTAIAHGMSNGFPFWNYIGRVRWNDTDKVSELAISPVMLCADSDAGTAEIDRAYEALNDYLYRHGTWGNDGQRWSPFESNGRAAITESNAENSHV